MRRVIQELGIVVVVVVGCTGVDSPVAPGPVIPDEASLAVIWNYSASALLMPPNTIAGVAYAINDLDVIVGYVEDMSTGNALPTLWDAASSPTVLNSSGALYGGIAHDINNRGEVVGELRGYGQGYLGILWSSAGTMKLSQLPGDDGSIALGINERRVVVGASIRGLAVQAVRWFTPGPAVSLHPGGVWTESQAEDINERGDVAGWVRNAAGVTHAFRWNANGTTTDLGPHSFVVPFSGLAFGIDNRANVAGRADNRRGTSATVWYASGQVTQFLPPASGTAYAISDNYRVVGWEHVSPLPFPFTGTAANTWEYLPGSPPNYSSEGQAFDVNTCGTIAGWLRRFSTGRRPVKWVKAECDQI